VTFAQGRTFVGAALLYPMAFYQLGPRARTAPFHPQPRVRTAALHPTTQGNHHPMKPLWRTLAAVVALTLPLLGLTGCTDTDDECDAAGTTTITLVAAQQQLVAEKGGGGRSSSRSGGGKSSSGKAKSGHTTVHHNDDCEDDD
jgi:hypothetical protein